MVFPEAAFGDGCRIIARKELMTEGLQWDNIHDLYYETTFAGIMYAMAINGVAFGVIGWYIRILLPSNISCFLDWVTLWYNVYVMRNRILVVLSDFSLLLFAD